MIYNKELLIKYCAENSVILDKEYDKVNRDTRIEGNVLMIVIIILIKDFVLWLKLALYVKRVQ